MTRLALKSKKKYTFSEHWHDEPSSGFHFADVKTRLTPLWNSGTFAAEFRWEARAFDVARDEVVADDVNGTNAVGVARVDAAVRTVWCNQRRYAELIGIEN